MSLSLLLQQCPMCLVHLIWMVFKIFQDLFNTARSTRVQLPSSFFSIRLVSVHVVHPYWHNCCLEKTVLFYRIGLISI